MKRLILALPLLFAGCSGGEEPAPEPTPTATMATERTLVATDYDPEIVGQLVEGSENEVELTAMGKPLGKVASSVFCIADGGPCAADEAPPVYTYVHRVTLAAAPEGEPTPAASPSSAKPAIVEIGPTLFRMTRAAPGFNLSVGYSRDEAEAALGAPEAIKVTLDREQIVWRVTGGDGWQPGATITVWWQSTLPPEEASKAYLLEVDGKQADVSGPFPAEEKSDTP